MISLNMRCKSVVLVLVMALSGSICVANPIYSNPFPQVASFVYDHKRAITATVIAGVLAKIRLKVKGTKYDYKLEDWREDVKKLLHSYNIFDIETYKTIVHMIDKWLVGRAFKIEITTTRVKNENGEVVTTHGKKIVSKPFGGMGLFSALVLDQMKELNDYIPMIAAFAILLTDPVYAVEKAQTK
jgi:hypothetical protein